MVGAGDTIRITKRICDGIEPGDVFRVLRLYRGPFEVEACSVVVDGPYPEAIGIPFGAFHEIARPHVFQVGDTVQPRTADAGSWKRNGLKVTAVDEDYVELAGHPFRYRPGVLKLVHRPLIDPEKERLNHDLLVEAGFLKGPWDQWTGQIITTDHLVAAITPGESLLSWAQVNGLWDDEPDGRVYMYGEPYIPKPKPITVEIKASAQLTKIRKYIDRVTDEMRAAFGTGYLGFRTGQRVRIKDGVLGGTIVGFTKASKPVVEWDSGAVYPCIRRNLEVVPPC